MRSMLYMVAIFVSRKLMSAGKLFKASRPIAFEHTHCAPHQYKFHSTRMGPQTSKQMKIQWYQVGVVRGLPLQCPSQPGSFAHCPLW